MEITLFEIPAEGTAGQPLAVNWTVQNNGVAAADNSGLNENSSAFWYDGVFLSLDTVVDKNDIRLSSLIHNGILNPSETYNADTEVEIPIYASGMYYLLIKADTRDDIYEHQAEGNNMVMKAVNISLPPPSDLIVTDITVPADAVAGEPVTISWTVTNQGINTASGWMSEAVYISDDAGWEYTDPLLGILKREINLSPGATARMSMRTDLRKAYRSNESGTITGEMPGVLPGEYYIAVRTDIKNNIREKDDLNNTAISQNTISVQIKELTPGTPYSSSLETGMQHYYMVKVPADQDLLITLDGESDSSANELYVSKDVMPTRIDYDFMHTKPFESDQEITIPGVQAEAVYYIMVRSENTPDELSGYTINAELLPFSITNLDPVQGGNAGQVTMLIEGARFNPITRIELIGAGETIAPVWWEINSPIRIYATFDLKDVSPGYYDVRVVSEQMIMDVDEQTGELFERNVVYGDFTLPSGFEVVQGGGPVKKTLLTVPSSARYGNLFSILVDVANEGNNDLTIPVLLIASPNGAPLSVSPDVKEGYGSQEQIVVMGKRRPTILAPGEKARVQLYARAVTEPSSEFVLQDLTSPGELLDWDSLESYYRDDSDPSAWAETWANFRGIVGDTWDGLHEAMRRAAEDLYQITGKPYYSGNHLILDLISRARNGQKDESKFHSRSSGCNISEKFKYYDLFEDSDLVSRSRRENIGSCAGPKCSIGDQGCKYCIEEKNPDFLLELEDDLKEVIFNMRLVYGNEASSLYELYLDENISDRSRTIKENNYPEIINGTWKMNGFKNSDKTIETVSKILEFCSRSFTCEDFEGEFEGENERSFDVRELIERQLNISISEPVSINWLNQFIGIDLDFNPNPWGGDGIAGLLAGGGLEGYSNTGVKDERYLSGEIIATVLKKCNKIKSIELKSNFEFTVIDAIDFCPGNIGDWKAQIFGGTKIMQILEGNCKAKSVPFTVIYKPEPKTHTVAFYDLPKDCESTKCPIDAPASECSIKCSDECNEGGNKTPKKCKGDNKNTDTIRPIDPNDIIGPAGYGDKKWVSSSQNIFYTINFENDPELASAPAQIVAIRQTLDTDLDPRTFRLGTFGFGDHVFTIPENRSFYSERIDLTDSLNIYVDVSAGIDITTNEAFWIFRSIDPATGQAPSNPFAGFLPVNDPETHVGEGFVNYTIEPKQDVVTGDVIDAKAQIVFDINEPIDTPAIFNTIDANTPTSQLQSTAEFTDDTTFTLNWSGQDVEGGSGLNDYTLYMSVDDRPYEIYESNLTDTSLMVTVEPKHKYRFFIIANDNAGNMEPMKSTAELLVDLDETEYELTLEVIPAGSGTLTPAEGVYMWSEGEEVQIQAFPEPGFRFACWTGEVTDTQSASTTLTMDTAKTVTAVFLSDGAWNLDIDGNGTLQANKDGFLLMRYLYNVRGENLIAGALGSGATRTTAAEIEEYIAQGIAAGVPDIDGNQTLQANKDGFLIMRYLYNVRGENLIAGAVGSGAVRITAAEIEAYIQSLYP